MKMRCKKLNQKQIAMGILLATTLIYYRVAAQDGNAGIDEATTMVKSYFDSGANLMYAVGALLGLIGGVKV